MKALVLLFPDKKEVKPLEQKADKVTTPEVLTPFQAWDIMRQQGGKIFTVHFIKKNGELRKMNCRLGVKKGLKGGENKAAKKYSNLRPVYDVQKDAYRMINLATLVKLRANGQEYTVLNLKDGEL